MPHKDPEARKEWQWKRNLRRRYKMTPEDYFKIYNKNKGKCGLCGKIPKNHRSIHIDHCHKTGKVRGILCHVCNRNILGFIEKVGFKKIAKYLGFNIIK